jgi:hypothetical protein
MRDIPPITDEEAYRASVARAKRDCAAFRIQHGLNPNPEQTSSLSVPVNTSVRPSLARVIVMPLRLHLDESAGGHDRRSRLAVRIAELIEEGYSTIEIRRQCDFEDAAVEGDSY